MPYDDFDETQRSCDALKAVRFIDDYHTSGPEGVAQIELICRTLAGRDTGMGNYGGLARNVADAISKAYLNKPLD